MDRSRKIFRKIASASDQVVAAANTYADIEDSNGVPHCHFQLEKDMRRISVACTCLASVLEKPSPDGGPVVDVRIQDWLNTDEPQECLNTLRQMKNLLEQATSGLSWVQARLLGRGWGSTTTQNKIKEAVDLFNACKGWFHFLFSTEIWNNQRAVRKQQDVTQDQDSRVQREFDVPKLGFLVSDEIEVDTPVPLIAEETQVALHADNHATMRETVDGKHGHAATRRHEVKTGRQKEEEEKNLEDILKWLDGLNCAEKQDATLSLRQEDTCKWLFDTTQYQTWKEGGSAFLWLRGKAGAGKSVLASFVIDSLRKAQREGEILLFFYCDFRTERSTSSAEVMRSILSQLFRQLRGHSVDLKDILDDLIKAKEWGGGTLNNAKKLAGFASRAAGVLGRKPLVVVDALDECTDLRQLIRALMAIRAQVRLFVTSRPLHTIVDDLSGIPFVSMEDMAERLLADIELHVGRELDGRQRLRGLDPGFKMEIRSTLCMKADGMFRWVQCSIDTLDRCMTRKEVRNALDNLPKGLEETYERILRAIDTEDLAGKLARRALVWLVAALRPLRLSEMMEALSINLGTRTLDLDVGPMHSGVLLDACGSLIIYSEKTEIVILAHSSVKEYLMGRFTRDKLPRYHINLEQAHLLLARSSMCYIAVCLSRAQGSAPANVSSRRADVSSQVVLHPQLQPLLDYVLDDALAHFEYLGSTFKLVLPDITMLADVIQCNAWTWDHVYTPARWRIGLSSRPHWPTSTHDLLLYILVAFAPISLMSAIFRRAPLEPKEGTNPLVYAAYFNKDEHARTLLSLGARLNERGWEIVGYCQSLPIEVAFRNRHYAAVTLLVEEGSTVPPRLFMDSFFRHDELFIASSPWRMVPSSVARVLLQSDELAESMSSYLNEVALLAFKEAKQLLLFRNASEQDLIVIIRRLVQVANARFTPDFIREAFLQLAVAQGYFSVARYLLTTLDTPLPSNLLVTLHQYPGRWKSARMIQFLVDNGADVLARTSDGDSVLHAILWAAGDSLGYRLDDVDEDHILEAVKFVVRRGCDPHERDSWGNTPLHTAVEQGYSSVAQCLLALGAPLPPNLIPTLNHKKAGRWCTAPMIHLLFQNDVGAERTALGDSVLCIALKTLDNEDEALEALKVLVEHGCNPLEADSYGNTPLQIAVNHGHLSIARYLLACGALLPPNLLQVFTLDYGSKWRTAGMIQFLVENGLDVAPHTGDADSALHIVLRHFDDENSALEAVKLLVDNGCDPLEADSLQKTPLQMAVERGHISIARYLLTLGALPSPDLLIMLKRGQPGRATALTIHFLIENGVDVLAHTGDRDSVLRTVLRYCNDAAALEAVKVLVRHGCDPFGADSCGNIPLCIAIQRGHILVTRYLLSLGAHRLPGFFVTAYRHNQQHPPTRFRSLAQPSDEDNPLAHTDNGDSILHAVLQAPYSDNEAVEVVKLLVGYGSNPLEPDMHGQTPLHLAVQQGHVSVTRYLLTLGASIPHDLLVALNVPELSWSTADMIPFLIENGVNVLAHTDDGDSVLHVMLRSTSDDAETLMAMNLLVNFGCDPLTANTLGQTPLHLAVRKGYVYVTGYLLTLGASIPHDLLAVPHAPVCASHIADMIPFLIENGVNALAHTDDGDSVLHVMLRSTYNDHKALMATRFLVSCGCDPLEANTRGETPLHLAVQRDYISVVRYLLTLGASIPRDLLLASHTLIMTWSWNTADMVPFLIENGVNVLAHTEHGSSALHVMLQFTYDEHKALVATKFLVNCGCDPLEANACRETPLHLAVQRGFISVVRYLITLGASIPRDLLVALDDLRWLSGTVCMIPFLVEKGVDVLAHTDDGDSVLHIMLRSTDDDDEALVAMKFLVSRGCDPLEANTYGETPLHLAVYAGHVSVVRYLHTLGASIPHDLLVALHIPVWSWYTADMIPFLIKNGVNALAHTDDGDSVLHVMLRSTYNDHKALVATKFLVSYGCDPLEANPRGQTPLHLAIRNGHISVARYLLALGPSIPYDLLVAPHAPVWSWRTVDMIPFLIKNGANVFAHTDDGDSVLHVMLRFTNYDHKALVATKSLVSYGCDPLEANIRGQAPLHVAVQQGHVSVARYLHTLGASIPHDILVAPNAPLWSSGTVNVIPFLVKKGVDVLAHTDDGDSVLHVVLRSMDDDNEALVATKLLVSCGCDPLEANIHGQTPLHHAIQKGHVSVAKYLLTFGAFIHPCLLVKLDHNKWICSASMICFLLDNGIDVLARTNSGDSVFHMVLESISHDYEALTIMKILVSCGCEPNEANLCGNSPLHVAVKKGHISVARYLLTLGVTVPPDLLVALNGHHSGWATVSMIRFLSKNGVNLLARASNGDSVLHMALRCSNDDIDVLETLKLLVQYNCDPLEASSCGTPMHIAVERGHISAARHLLSLGASVPPDLFLTLNCHQSLWSTTRMIRFLFENSVDFLVNASGGNTVIHLALQCSNGDKTILEAVRLLVHYGCDLLKANSRGETPLHFAARQSHIAIARDLITRGASVLTKALNGDTVLHFAASAENTYLHDRTYDRHIDHAAFWAVRFFVERGCDPAVPNDIGKTPLHNAVERGLLRTMKYLLQLTTPLPTDILFTAIQSDYTPAYRHHIIETLVASGCDTQTPNAQGVTPLQAAIIKGRVDVVEYLLSVVSACNLHVEDFLLATKQAPDAVRSEMRRLLSKCRNRSKSPDLPPAKRARHS